MIKTRINCLLQLGNYLRSNDLAWQTAKEKAARSNGWFTEAFIDRSVQHICAHYLSEEALQSYSALLQTAETKQKRVTIGLTMAGNIPMVGFHDFMSIYLSGHRQLIRFSSKDDVLLPFLINYLYSLDPAARELITAADMLKNCDAYIATGSNSSALYFEKYFAPYPHIIRKNKTSVAILTGDESEADLAALADDIFLFFGLGCRNVSKIYVPEKYDFLPLLNACKRYDELQHHHKYKNNYDYNLAIFILNNQFYMSTDALLLSENDANFSGISVLHYAFYSGDVKLLRPEELQTVCGIGHTPFGQAQNPAITDFADGVNTIDFLNSL